MSTAVGQRSCVWLAEGRMKTWQWTRGIIWGEWEDAVIMIPNTKTRICLLM